jgi:ribose 5-phosphate isomerase B
MFDFNQMIAIGSDHAGFKMKGFLISNLEREGYQFQDFGTDSEESVDYSDYIHPLAKAVDKGAVTKGIIICGTANGVAITANKYRKVRAAVCWDEQIVRLSRLHNDANIIALPARFISPEEALSFVKLFFSTDFEGGRHERRVQKISDTL